MSGLLLTENVFESGFKSAYFVDIAAVVFFFVLCLHGARRGAIRLLLGFVAAVAAIVIAFVFADKFATKLNEWFSLGDSIARGIEKSLLKIKGFDADLSETGMTAALEGVSLPSFIKKALIGQFADSSLPEGTTLASKAGVVMSGYILRLIAWIALFLLVKLGMSLICRLLSGVTERIVVLSAANSLLGGCIGALKAFAIVCGVLAIVALLPSGSLSALLNETFFIRYLYNENPILKLFSL